MRATCRCALVLLALVVAGCQPRPQEASLVLPPRLAGKADLRITEEPYESQTVISRRMDLVAAYLKEATGLTVEYVPAINYAHSHELPLEEAQKGDSEEEIDAEDDEDEDEVVWGEHGRFIEIAL